MSDAGGQASNAHSKTGTTAADAALSEVESSGSPRGTSQRGSATATTADQQLSTGDNEVSNSGEQQPRKRTSFLMVPSSGGVDSVGSLNANGAEDEGGSLGGGTAGRESLESGVGGVSTVESEEVGYLEVVAWIKEHLVLPEFVPEKHWRGEHNEVSYCHIRALMQQYCCRVVGCAHTCAC